MFVQSNGIVLVVAAHVNKAACWRGIAGAAVDLFATVVCFGHLTDPGWAMFDVMRLLQGKPVELNGRALVLHVKQAD